MRLDEIKEKVIAGELRLSTHNMGMSTRRLSVYSKTKGEEIMGKFYGDFEKFRTITYPRVVYLAGKDKDSGYRINKKVYKELLKELANCVSCTDNIIKENG
jgi:hypothetical protein